MPTGTEGQKRPAEADPQKAGKQKRDDAAEFVHDLAEDAPPKDLETVKAATDAKEASDDQVPGT